MVDKLKTKFFVPSIASLLIAALLLYIYHQALASPLANRSVVIGSSTPSANTTHDFRFTIQSISPLGSIEFEYCDNSPFIGTPCNAPVGLNLSAAVLSSQTGETGFTIDPSSSVNRLVLTRVPVPPSAIPVTYTFSNVINQSATNAPVYVRISTFASSDTSGPRTDEGAVLYSTASQVLIAGYVPPFLTFCTGVTVAVNCTSANGSFLNFGELSTTQTRFLSSEFSGATNDPGGFSTSLSGITMTSGSNVIPALTLAQPSQPGTSQFGMNLRANTLPAVGQEPQGLGTSNPLPPVDTPNLFAFNNQVITNSTIPTDFRKFTASYIVNISSSQRPGVYNTTLTYIAVAAF